MEDSPKERPGFVFLPNRVTVKELAEKLQRRPFELIGVLMEKFGMFVTLKTDLEFTVAKSICERYGVTAIHTS